MYANELQADIVVGIGNAIERQKIQESLKNVNLVTLIHPTAILAKDITIGKGTVVMAGAVINPGVIIGDGCIINTCSSIDHDCIIGECCVPPCNLMSRF